jgi:hypothetical protein
VRGLNLRRSRARLWVSASVVPSGRTGSGHGNGSLPITQRPYTGDETKTEQVEYQRAIHRQSPISVPARVRSKRITDSGGRAAKAPYYGEAGKGASSIAQAKGTGLIQRGGQTPEQCNRFGDAADPEPIWDPRRTPQKVGGPGRARNSVFRTALPTSHPFPRKLAQPLKQLGVCA